MKFARWMDSFRGVGTTLLAASALATPLVGSRDAQAADGLFQKPSRPSSASAGAVQFRSPSGTALAAATTAPTTPAPAVPTTAVAGNPLRSTNAARVVATGAATTIAPPVTGAEQATFAAARPIAQAPRPAVVKSTAHKAAVPSFALPDQDLSGLGTTPRSRAIAAASIEPWVNEQPAGLAVQQAGFCDCGEPTCGICEPACGLAEPGCGIVEPGCGMEPGCCMEPECGIIEPGCGMEPDCGMVGCGSCVGNPGPDYWCFPVCLPRFKDLRFWAGVHGFKGPRDSPAFGGAGDGNFGFQEGVNIGGRAPLVSLLFPQISYQLGYQAVQSQLSGLSDGSTEDRSQQFVTAGLFRRVNAGIQFGVAWDLLRDDFQMEEDFNQLRYEISLKSRAGREFGFWGASHLNTKAVGGTNFESVDQYCGFIRCHFRDGGALRFWGGATNDSEGLFGGDFVAPLNNRWSIQTGFNYLIPDIESGAIAAREESWNVGINMVWHYGCTAKKGQFNPHAPLFPVADNGWMFIDQAP